MIFTKHVNFALEMVYKQYKGWCALGRFLAILLALVVLFALFGCTKVSAWQTRIK